MKAAIIRLVRILIAQGISFAIVYYANVQVPILNIGLGALISAIAKYLRDKYGMNWLPV